MAYTEKDLADAFREGWKQRDRTIGIIQATTARDEVYGVPRRAKASVRPAKYHASLFRAWLSRHLDNPRPIPQRSQA